MLSFGCQAILFDLDGALVDSTPAVVNTWNEWAKAHGMNPNRILEVAHGRRTVETIRLVASDLDAEAEAKKLERMEMEDLEGVYEIDGARELLSSLPTDRWAIVTSGTRPLATRRLEYTSLPLPEILVSAEDVTNGKPNPEAYLKGAHRVGLSPEGCLVVKDAPSGVAAGRAAGMVVIAVATTHHGDELTEANVVAQSLADIRVSVEPEPGPSDESGRRCLRVRVDQ